MVKFLIHRPVAVFMVTLAFILFGFVTSLQIATDLLPDIDIPEITIQLSYPENTAREIETNVVRPLRNQLLQVSNLKEVVSETRDGFSTLKLYFNFGTKIDYAFIEVNEKIDGSLNFLPRNLERPKVIKASSTDIPIINFTIALKDDYNEERFLELSEFTETVLKKRIEQLPDIALADMSGHTKPEIIITPNKKKIQTLGIINEDIIKAIQQNNFELGNLIIQNGIYQYNFKFSNPLQTLSDIENIYLNINNKIFRLGELANVTLKPELDRGLVYFNGKRAIVLSIIKQADARVYNLKESLNVLKASFSEDYPYIEFSTNQDQTESLKLSIDNLKSSLLISSVLAILIMFVFLNDLKTPLIIAFSIPVSLIISILFMYVFGLSINIISLSGLILGVGIMIDNSIIVIDNITQKIEKGVGLNIACIEGTNEVITPLITSVLTTCSVFLPLTLLNGVTGALFYDQAMSISIGLGSSLLVSILLIPVIYRQISKKKYKIKTRPFLNFKTQNIESWYEKGHSYFFKRKWVLYLISSISLIVALVLFNSMEYSMLPDIKKNETLIHIDWNENINVYENQERIQFFLSQFDNIEAQFSEIGEQRFLFQRDGIKASSEASIYINTNSSENIDSIKLELSRNIKHVYPESNIQYTNSKSIFEYIFGTNKNRLIAEVYSSTSLEVPNENKIEHIISRFANNISSKIPLKETALIHVIHENVLLYDIKYEDLINELKAAFQQNFIDNLKTSQNFIPIKLNYEKKTFDKIINSLFVKSQNNDFIPVKHLIRVDRVSQYKTIKANRGGEYLGFDIVTGRKIEHDIESIERSFREDKQNTVRFSGSWIDLKELNNQLIIVAIVAFLLLYFIMAAQFESLRQPLIILIEIPIDFGAALFLLWLFGGTINVMAAIGIVVMSGLVINDSILKIHTTNMLRKQGYSIDEAIIKAGKMRIKPILMTSLTTILALTPFLFMNGLGAELQKPLALTVIGGMILGTFLSIYFVPILYYRVSKNL